MLICKVLVSVRHEWIKLCLSPAVGDRHSGGWKVPLAEGNSWTTKGEREAWTGLGSSPTHLQNRGLWFGFWLRSIHFLFGSHQTRASGLLQSWTLNQTTHKAGEAQTKDNYPHKACNINRLCCCYWIRVTSHPSSLHALYHVLHSWHSFHLPLCLFRHQCLQHIPRYITPGKCPAVSGPTALWDSSSPQQQQRWPVGSLPALTNHPLTVIDGPAFLAIH